MQIRPLRLAMAPALALVFVFAGCNSGSGSASRLSSPACASGSTKFCLVSCNLGCSNTSCSVSQIAQNQSIQLTFSQAVDPTSVNSGTVLLRTAGGEPPIGDLLVSDRTITFQPRIEIQGGATFFGFRANETYVLTVPSGTDGGASLRSTSGEPLGAQVSCQLVVSRGIIDLDNQPPRPTLISPATLTGVSRGAAIVLEFSELIDAAPFAGGGEGSPVEFGVSRTTRQGGAAVCSETATVVPLPGVPLITLDRVRNVATVTFRPSVQLPGETCVEVRVTNRVHDLSGRSAEPVTYRFVTEAAPIEDLAVVEEFDNEGRLDRSASSTIWSGGLAQPGVIGGTGKLGDFNPANGPEIGGGVRVWDLDIAGGIVIPGNQTLSGREARITDGNFEFTNFRVPAGVTVRFVGTQVPKIWVRGEVVIQGTIDLAGVVMGQLANSFGTVGQPGGVGGAGGGRGGNGSGPSNGTPGFNGEHGQDVRVPAGHAYQGNIVGTGGRGGLQYPADNASVTHNYITQCAQVAAGGSGGGFFAAGSSGVALRSPSTPPELGPSIAGGIAFSLFPIPAGRRSIDHFLVGGSGGGGGGSSIFGHRNPNALTWRVGCGGSGGGGAIAIRAGGPIQLTTAAPAVSFNVRGGDAFTPYLHQIQGPPAPGGGGSGGSVLLQSAASIAAAGIIDLRGGLGVWIQPGTTQGLFIEARGGDGAPGFVRAEAPGSAATLSNVRPALDPRMIGPLTDSDTTSGFLTKWYATGQLFAPRFVRYEVEAVVGGNVVIYSDDPTRGVWAPLGGGTPIEIGFQAGRVEPRDGTLIGAPPVGWKGTVGAHQGQTGITGEGIDGFRYNLVFNRADVVLRKVTVFFQV
jgi:hypothetical protein